MPKVRAALWAALLALGLPSAAAASVSFGGGGTGLSIGGIGSGGGTVSGRLVITGSNATSMLDVTNTNGSGVAGIFLNSAAGGGVAGSFQRSGTGGTAVQIGDNSTLTNWICTAAGATTQAAVLTVSAGGIDANASGAVAANIQRAGAAGNALQVGDNSTETNFTVTAAGAITAPSLTGATTLALAGTGTGGTVTLTSPSTGTTAIIANATGPSTTSLFEVQQSGTARYLFAPSTSRTMTLNAQSGFFDASSDIQIRPNAAAIATLILTAAGVGTWNSTAVGGIFTIQTSGTDRYIFNAATANSLTFDADGTSQILSSTNLSLADTGTGATTTLTTAGNAVILNGTESSATADSDVAGITTASFGTTAVMPANSFRAGRVLRVTAAGINTTDAAPGNITMDVRIGTTVIVTTGAQAAPANNTDRGWRLVADIVCRTTGASGTLRGAGYFTISSAATTTQQWDMEQTGPGTTAIDTTASSTFDIQVTNTDAGTTVSSQVVVWECLF